MDELGLNMERLREMRKSGELEKYAGEHIVFVGGKVIDHDRDENVLSERVNKKYQGRNRHYYYVPRPGEKVPVAKFRSPRIVR